MKLLIIFYIQPTCTQVNVYTWILLYYLQREATYRDLFVRRLSVCLVVTFFCGHAFLGCHMQATHAFLGILWFWLFLRSHFLSDNSSLRRSLPNVSQRLAPAPGMYSSDPYLDNHSSGGSDDYEQQPPPQQHALSRLQPQVRPMSPGMSGLRQPSTPVRRGLSPQRTGLPTPNRRTIPRPGSTPKSGLPAPRRFVQSGQKWNKICPMWQKSVNFNIFQVYRDITMVPISSENFM